MLFCARCGEKLEQQSSFCTRCGARVNKQHQMPVTSGGINRNTRTIGEEVESVFLDDKVLPEVLRIVTSANRGVTFVTPYLGLWVHLKNAIEEATGRGVSVTFIVRAEERKQLQDLRWLREHKVRVYEVPNLHAKIYMNEKEVLVSSMNIYDSSALNSLEFAMLVRDDKDAKKLREYAIRMASKMDPSFQAISRSDNRSLAFCIRDGKAMDFDTSRPLCDKCYPKWARYKNRIYAEKFCHSCRKSVATTFARPLCSDCYRTLN